MNRNPNLVNVFACPGDLKLPADINNYSVVDHWNTYSEVIEDCEIYDIICWTDKDNKSVSYINAWMNYEDKKVIIRLLFNKFENVGEWRWWYDSKYEGFQELWDEIYVPATL